MKLQHYQNIHQITFLPHLSSINCYLVEEADGLTLIDTGMGFCGKGILKAAAALQQPIKRIVLTHAHGDHAGSLDFLISQLEHVTLCVSSREAKLLSNDLSLLSEEPNCEIKGSFQSISAKPDILLQEGDRVGSLQVIEVPGHTPGSLAFYDEKSKVLIVGDAFQLKGGIAVAGDKRPFFPFVAIATWNYELAIASANKLSDLDINLLAVGHGSWLEKPVASMKNAIERAKTNAK